jgi:hypothetical protein
MIARVRIAVLAMATLVAHAGLAAEREVDLELVLAADVSGSMDAEEAALQRRGFAAAVRHPDVVAAIRGGIHGRIAVTYVEWAGTQFQERIVDWTEIGDAADRFASAIEEAAPRIEMFTSISGALLFALASFEDNGFRGLRRVVDVSGDGPNNSGAAVPTARDLAVAAGITINGLPIVNDRPSRFGFPPMPNLDLYYADCVIGGPGAFIVVADGFADFARAIRRKMVLEIAGVSPRLPLLHLAAARVRPPCNAGEMRRLQWQRTFGDP